MRIAYIFPSRSRKTKFFNTLDNIKIFSESDNYFVWAKLDEDDETMNTQDVKDKIANEYPEVTVKWGLSDGKVHAVNRNCEDLPECDILIIQSDDIIWDVVGFDTEIREAFKAHNPGLDSTIHFPDDHGGQRTIIVSILGINLYKQLGYLYNSCYESVFCDDDFTHFTKLSGKYYFINKRLFTHNHPIWTKFGWDAQYYHSERPEVYKKDGDIFFKRKANNFGL